jgi:predicted RNA-binding protein (virulence factor B family)
VLDIDTSKMIVDLSERLAESKASKDFDLKAAQKAIVELNKEQYLIVTFKKARHQVGVCIPNDFTQVNKTELYAKYKVGSEVNVRIIKSEETDGFILTLPVEEQTLVKPSKNDSFDEGSLISGPVRSIKGNCLFVQV